MKCLWKAKSTSISSKTFLQTQIKKNDTLQTIVLEEGEGGKKPTIQNKLEWPA
jgi:hypothetical protein